MSSVRPSAFLREEPRRDRRVVTRGGLEGLERELALQAVGQRTGVLLELVQHAPVVGRIGDDADKTVVFRGGTHHRRSADVDLLDRFLARHAGLGDRRLERVEVDHHEIDRGDAVLLHRTRRGSARRAARGCRRAPWGAAS
jgi:hypothetical protein